MLSDVLAYIVYDVCDRSDDGVPAIDTFPHTSIEEPSPVGRDGAMLYELNKAEIVLGITRRGPGINVDGTVRIALIDVGAVNVIGRFVMASYWNTVPPPETVYARGDTISVNGYALLAVSCSIN